jgi:hypothetical protein
MYDVITYISARRRLIMSARRPTNLEKYTAKPRNPYKNNGINGIYVYLGHTKKPSEERNKNFCTVIFKQAQRI